MSTRARTSTNGCPNLAVGSVCFNAPRVRMFRWLRSLTQAVRSSSASRRSKSVFRREPPTLIALQVSDLIDSGGVTRSRRFTGESRPCRRMTRIFHSPSTLRRVRAIRAEFSDSASALIEGFELADEALVGIVDGKIKTLMVLEDAEGGSIKVWLKKTLTLVVGVLVMASCQHNR